MFQACCAVAPNVARAPLLSPYRSILAKRETYVFCLLYFVTFGGFVGFSSFLNTFFVNQFSVPKATVGIVTVPFVIAGSVMRPVGGGLSDWLGGPRVLGILFALITLAVAGAGLAIADQPAIMALMLVGMGCLGMGNGAVFQIIPQRYRNEIGAITGLVGAVGGIGGFFLNIVLGDLKDMTGSYATGFYIFAAAALATLAILRSSRGSWSWLPAHAGRRPRRDPHAALGLLRG